LGEDRVRLFGILGAFCIIVALSDAAQAQTREIDWDAAEYKTTVDSWKSADLQALVEASGGQLLDVRESGEFRNSVIRWEGVPDVDVVEFSCSDGPLLERTCGAFALITRLPAPPKTPETFEQETFGWLALREFESQWTLRRVELHWGVTRGRELATLMFYREELEKSLGLLGY
jgi:hypothetical protein